MPRIDTVTKLNSMYELFTKRDDGKLTSGEVEALAGFYAGLPAAGKAKAKDRLVAIFQSSQYTTGMKERFKKALLGAGLHEADLKAKPAGGMTSVEKEALFDKLSSLSEDGGGDGVTKTISMAKVPWDLQSPLQDALEALKTRTLKKDANAEFGDVLIKAIYEPDKNGKPGPLAGYTIELGIYSDDHDVDRRLSFSRTGVQVGDEYVGE
jgi:hypothetical protein